MAVEVIRRNQFFQGDGNWIVEAAGFGWTEHGRLRTYVPLV
jgi:hypothetical protein